MESAPHLLVGIPLYDLRGLQRQWSSIQNAFTYRFINNTDRYDLANKLVGYNVTSLTRLEGLIGTLL